MVKSVICNESITKEYFRNHLPAINALYEDEGIEKISIAWDGEIIDSEPSVSRKTLYYLNQNFHHIGKGDTEVYLVNPKQLDIVTKPLIVSSSPRNLIRTMLCIDDVKKGLEHVIENEGPVKITRNAGYGDDIDFNIEFADDRYISVNFNGHDRGYDILHGGLRDLRIRNGIEFDWWWVPPVTGAIILGAAGVVYGYISEVWAEGTYGAVEKAQIINGLKGAGIGAGFGSVVSVLAGLYKKGADIVDEPIRRIKLSNELKAHIKADKQKKNL